jgi:glycine/D-amino acid oxidase-like deaminating enzyme
MSKRADAVVIGGGLIGSLIALELRAHGAGVCLVEKDDVGFEQSGRSVAAVNLAVGTPNPDPKAGIFKRSAEQWSIFEERWQCPIDLNSDGWVIVVRSDEDEAWLETDRMTWRQTAGFTDTVYLDENETRARFPQIAGRVRGADLRYGGHVDAVMVMKGLREALDRANVDVLRGVTAVGFAAAGPRVTAVMTSQGAIGCGLVVIAGGMWSSQLCDKLGFHIPMQRVRAPAVEVGPVPAGTVPGFLRAAAAGAKQNRNGTVRVTGGYRDAGMIHDVRLSDLRDMGVWGPRLWHGRDQVKIRVDLPSLAREARALVARRSDGVATFASQDIPMAKARDRAQQVEMLAELIPALRGAGLYRYFAGVMDLTPDLQPVIGVMPGIDNCYLAAGFSGHGYLAGPGACMAIADVIVHGRSEIDLELFDPLRVERGFPMMRAQIF